MHPRCMCSYIIVVPELDGKKTLKKNLDESKIKKYNKNIQISGAITDLYSFKASKHAELYYEEIRKRKSDVARISSNTGYKEEEIQEIKQYLFIDEQDLLDGVRRFDPDFAIAQSWQRLQHGEIEKHDLTLIKHELLEKELIKQGYSQYLPHREASKKYNYKKRLMIIMVTLKNIRREKNKLICDYYEEDSIKSSGQIWVDVNDLDVYNVGDSKGYNSCIAHALSTLRKIIQGDLEFKEEYIIMWY